jgi:hypothetical protein
MDAHRTVQGSVAISAILLGRCGPAAATPVCIHNHWKLLPVHKKQSPQESKLFNDSANWQNSRWAKRYRIQRLINSRGVKLMKKGNLVKGEKGG